MSKTTSLFVKNAKTFYNYRTGAVHSLRSRYVAFVLIALLLSIVFGSRSDNLYLGVITAQSILAGFGFNVMISLAFNRNIRVAPNVSIERADKIKTVNRLARELFYNVAYFNAIALGSIVISVLLLLVPAFWSGWPLAIRTMLSQVLPNDTNVIWWLKQVGGSIRRIAIFALYLFVIESFATFVRAVQRASHYFENRIKLDPAGA